MVLSADDQVFADVVVLVALFDDVQVNAVVAFLGDEAWSAAVASGSVIEGHPFELEHEHPPFGLVDKLLPFGSVHEGHPSRMVWFQWPLVVAACSQELHC